MTAGAHDESTKEKTERGGKRQRKQQDHDILLFLLLGLVGSASLDPNVMCQNIVGFIRNENDCQKWYRCNGGEKTDMPPCESGFVFSIKALSCVPVTHKWNDCPKPVDVVNHQVNQSIIDYLGTHLDITYEVIENHPKGKPVYIVELTLTNQGPITVKGGGWEIYFCNIMKIAPLVLKDPNNVTFTHIQGCLFSMKTTATLFSGQSKKIRYTAMNWSIARTDIMPNWYVYMKGLQPRILNSTAGESLDFVKPFLTAKQYKRTGPSDVYHPFSPRERYGKNAVEDARRPMTPVLPTPEKFYDSNDRMNITPNEWVIVSGGNVIKEATYLSEKLHIPMKQMAIQKKFIYLTVDSSKFDDDSSNSEGYKIKMSSTDGVIDVRGVSQAGVFYGVQTLLSLIEGDQNSGYSIQVASIEDRPRYPYRGVQIDVGRNFHPKDDIIKLLKVMAMYKMNKLHLHLTDDEGWRLQIPGFPELTDVGSKRCSDLNEETCLSPQLGSGPFSNASVNGFYTVDDYKEIIKFADDSHIEVIPEIDMPGHARAAIKAMLVRAKKNSGPSAQDYLLTDPDDNSVYESVQMYSDNAANPCVPGTARFVARMIDALIEMHKDIQPLRTYHFGGDEVGSGAWVNSPACKKMLKSEMISTDEVKKHFVHQVSKMSSLKSLNLAAWEDGMMGGQEVPFPRHELPNKDVFVYAWDNVWEWDRSSRAYRFANHNYKVVMSQATHLYFDHPYEPDPEERGFYWATRYTDTAKTFSFQPDSLYRNIDTNRSGQKLTLADVCGPDGKKCVQLQKPGNIIGMQAHLWSETVRTSDHVFEMYLPRLIAAAERAWHKADFEKGDAADVEKNLKTEWTNFANTLGYKELHRLDQMGIPYHIPRPGAYVTNKRKLVVGSAFPGLTIEVSYDDQISWKPVTPETTALKGQTIHLRTRSADMKRASRVIKMNVK